MFQGEDIKELVKLFKRRDVYLYHACQLLDFQSYLNVGGIPSRSHLESKSQPYTPFSTDHNDRINLDWDKVFTNLSDFGSTFARGFNAVPNIYGPILFKIKPEALLEATDVAICLRSAGSNGFNREIEAIKSLSGVNNLFKHSVEDPDFRKRSYVKNRQDLKKDFKCSYASAPEISCTLESGSLSLKYVKSVQVEPYIIQGQRLKVKVEELIENSSVRFQVYKRDHTPPYTNELIEILKLKGELPSIQNLSQNPSVSSELRDWSIKLMENKLEYQFGQFAKYLYNGTISPLLKGQI